jgi:hypothetical protein
MMTENSQTYEVDRIENECGGYRLGSNAQPGAALISRNHEAKKRPQEKAHQMQKSSDYLVLEDKRTDDVFKEQGVDLPPNIVSDLEHHDLYMLAQDALKYGVATKLGAFVPPSSGEVYSL